MPWYVTGYTQPNECTLIYTLHMFMYIHKFILYSYIPEGYTYNTIKTYNYIHISCTHIDKGERYITSTPIADIIDSINTYFVD